MKIKKYSHAILVGTGVVFFWRGLWGMMDRYLIPHAPMASYLVSIVIGLIILYYTHTLIKELE